MSPSRVGLLELKPCSPASITTPVNESPIPSPLSRVSDSSFMRVARINTKTGLSAIISAAWPTVV